MNSFCRFAEQCESYDRVSNVPGLSEGHNLCDKCWTRCSGDVTAMVFDYLDLSRIIARRDGHSEVKISRPKPESIPPIDLNVHTLRSDMASVLLATEMALRRSMRMPVRINLHAREGFNVQQAVGFVAPRVDPLAGLDLVPHFYDGEHDVSGMQVLTRLRAMHRRAHQLVGLAEPSVPLPGYCPQCAAAALSRRNGADTVDCGSCRFRWPREQYERHVTLQVTEHAHPVRRARQSP